MPNLTVSSAVDTFMQASDQAGMVSALGTISPSLPLICDSSENILESEDYTLLAIDDNNNPVLSAAVGDQINFDPSGVASVASAQNSGTQFPIALAVGTASANIEGYPGSIGPGQAVDINTYITGCQQGDVITVDFDENLPPYGGGTGAVVVACVVVQPGNPQITLLNTDLSNTWSLYGNMYVRAVRIPTP